jgi:transposase-like protein
MKKTTRRSFDPQDKIMAVLSVWTERRSIAQMCQEMAISPALLSQWQNQAMEAMVAALSPKKTEKQASLNTRLTRLIEKNLPDPSLKLEKRLKAVQKASKDNPS